MAFNTQKYSGFLYLIIAAIVAYIFYSEAYFFIRFFDDSQKVIINWKGISSFIIKTLLYVIPLTLSALFFFKLKKLENDQPFENKKLIRVIGFGIFGVVVIGVLLLIFLMILMSTPYDTIRDYVDTFIHIFILSIPVLFLLFSTGIMLIKSNNITKSTIMFTVLFLSLITFLASLYMRYIYCGDGTCWIDEMVIIVPAFILSALFSLVALIYISVYTFKAKSSKSILSWLSIIPIISTILLVVMFGGMF